MQIVTHKSARWRVIGQLLAIALASSSCVKSKASAPAVTLSANKASEAPVLVTAVTADSSRIDFATQIQPLLSARCQPCHFPGGKMYARLPFDRPETIRLLGDKLFTRIRDTQGQALVRGFLAQTADSAQAEQ